MYRTILAAALTAQVVLAPQAAVAAEGAASAACPKGRLCLYPAADFGGAPQVLAPPQRASGQCAPAGREFRSAINNSKHFVLTYSRPDCTIPATPLAMCCSDGLGSARSKDFGHGYLSIKWQRG